MEFVFPWPMSQGEWLAWSVAVATAAFGLLLFFAPGLSLKLLRLQTVPDHPEAVAGARATMAGFQLGLGACALLFAQPMLYLALGAAWMLAAFGRVISMLSDRGNTLHNWLWLVIELALGALPLAFAFGLVP